MLAECQQGMLRQQTAQPLLALEERKVALLVPPDTAGWMVRVRTAAPTDQFYLVAIADEAKP